MGRTLLLTVLGILFTALPVGYQISAQERFPAKPVKIVVPFEAGGSADLITRAIQPHVGKILGQSVVVVNRAGAAATIGYTEVAKEAPDGYTMVWVGPSIVLTTYTINADITYRNYDPVICLGVSPGAITVRADAPWKSLKEFLEYAKANPGKVRMSNSGHGGSTHLRTLGIELVAGVKFTHVPYKGSGPAMLAVLGGHVEGTAAVLSDAIQLTKGGKLKILALTAAERTSIVPEVPSMKELGMDFENGTWYAYMTPRKTPEERIKVLHDAMKGAMATPQFAEYMKNQAIVTHYLGTRDFWNFMERDEREWRRLIEAAGIKIVQ